MKCFHNTGVCRSCGFVGDECALCVLGVHVVILLLLPACAVIQRACLHDIGVECVGL